MGCAAEASATLGRHGGVEEQDGEGGQARLTRSPGEQGGQEGQSGAWPVAMSSGGEKDGSRHGDKKESERQKRDEVVAGDNGMGREEDEEGEESHGEGQGEVGKHAWSWMST